MAPHDPPETEEPPTVKAAKANLLRIIRRYSGGYVVSDAVDTLIMAVRAAEHVRVNRKAR